MNMAMESRRELEAQLRHVQTGLTEGQEAARQEGRKEIERLEARVRELLKDRSVVCGDKSCLTLTSLIGVFRAHCQPRLGTQPFLVIHVVYFP